MISFDFEYYRPDTVNEATSIYKMLSDSGKNPVFYGGGSEIISLARVNQNKFKSVIDLKNIPECKILTAEKNQIIIGAAVTLTQICEANLFPLLTEVVRRAADHTSRDRITLGGNICGSIPYREALLPFLVCDVMAVTAGAYGVKTVPVGEIFKSNITLQGGEFLVQIIIDSQYSALPYKSLKKTRQSEMEYPLVTAAAIKKDDRIRIAFSGICPYPFRSEPIEDDLNNTDLQVGERINNAILHLPTPIMDDMFGSSDYRQFILANVMEDVLSAMEEVK